MRVLVDISPLRTSFGFRRLWLGSTLSAVGSQMTTFAVVLQVYLMTHSSAAVGAIGLVAGLPALCLGLFAGVIVDAVDRRRLVLVTSTLLTAVSTALAVQAFVGLDQLWLLYALVAAQSLVASVDGPARRTFMPRLLTARQIPAGVAVTMLAMHASLLLGPVLAGLLASTGGLRLCYLLDAVSFLAALYGVARLPEMRRQGQAASPGLGAVREGLAFLRRSQVLSAALLADVSATFLAMPVSLFPAINAERFHGSPRTLGMFTAALAAGGLLGSAVSGPVGSISRQGRAMLAAGALWGLALAMFGIVEGLVPTLAFLTIAGAADMTSVVLRSTIIQAEAPDELRGRMSAAEYVVGAAMPAVGNFRAGVVGSLTTPGVSALVGGLAASAGAALLALAFPAFARYARPTQDTALAQSPS